MEKAEDPRIDDEIIRLARIARLLDSMFRIPGTGLTVGLDNLLGIIPGIGDGVAAIPAFWLVWRARKLGAPPRAIGLMILNVLIDLVLGTVPILGDLFDIAYNANIRNMRLLEWHLGRGPDLANTANPGNPA